MSDFDELNLGPRWYVIHTYSGYENKVKASIEKIVENRGLGHLIYDLQIPVETTIVTNEKGGDEALPQLRSRQDDYDRRKLARCP